MSLNNIKYICSIGSWCITGTLLKKANLKTESYPFDWNFTNIDVVKHCIEDNFKIF